MGNDNHHRTRGFSQEEVTLALRILRWVVDALGPSPAIEAVTRAQRILRWIADALDPFTTRAAVPPAAAQVEALAEKPSLTPDEVRLFEVLN